MYLDSQIPFFLADAPLAEPKTLRTEQQTDSIKNDPLIAKGWERTAYVGSIVFLLGVLAVVGIFSRKIEYVVILALLLSLVLIALFIFVPF